VRWFISQLPGSGLASLSDVTSAASTGQAASMLPKSAVWIK
jgi:hypothetical protein